MQTGILPSEQANSQMPENIISKSVTPGCGRSQPKVVPFIQVAQPALLHVSWATLLVFPLTHA